LVKTPMKIDPTQKEIRSQMVVFLPTTFKRRGIELMQIPAPEMVKVRAWPRGIPICIKGERISTSAPEQRWMGIPVEAIAKRPPRLFCINIFTKLLGKRTANTDPKRSPKPINLKRETIYLQVPRGKGSLTARLWDLTARLWDLTPLGSAGGSLS